MDRIVQPHSPSLLLEQVVADALTHLRAVGYSPNSLEAHRQVWDKLVRFSRSSSAKPVFSRGLVSRFLAHEGLRGNAWCAERRSFQRQVRRSLRILSEFSEQGSFRIQPKRGTEPVLPARFGETLGGYEHFSRDHLGHRPGTIAGRRKTLLRFLQFIASRGIRSLQDLRPVHISDYLASLTGVCSSSLATMLSHVRSFLRYLCMRGILKRDCASALRPIRFLQDQRLPTVWPKGAVQALLGAVDRRSAKGKRDYAILLLACRLGLRASDIRSLRLDEVHWSEACICIEQSKTSVPLTLPLDGQVGRALIDYLKRGRPATHHREVFLRMLAPVEPFSSRNDLASIVRSYVRRARIHLPPGTRQGLHALRHTLATRLLLAGERLETISAILGHRSVESTRVYTALDCEALRSVALDPEEVLHE